MTKEKFSELVLECEATLYRISMSMLKNESDCEDAVQTAILTAFEKLSTLKKEEFFKTWLVRILINVCNKQLKNRSRIVGMDEAGYGAKEPSVPSPVNNTEIRLALEKLPLKYRNVIVLYYIEGFSISEIKKIILTPEGTIKSRLSKGRSLLRQYLE